MADQGRWFKLWYEALSDPDLGNLTIDDFGRWAKFGVYLKAHGTDGSIRLIPPSTMLCSILQLPSFSAMISCFSLFPNCQISRDDDGVTLGDVAVTVKWLNWRKYQVDSSAERQRRYRHRKAFGVTTKKRGEEKRREEIHTPPVVPPPTKSANGFSTWPPAWTPIVEAIHDLPFLQANKHWLEDLAWWQTMDTRLQSCPARLNEILMDAVSYIASSGYTPASKKGLLAKLRNCMLVSAEKLERSHRARQTQHDGKRGTFDD